MAGNGEQSLLTPIAGYQRSFLYRRARKSRSNYHAEHHFYMGIPYHQLPRCHALLAATPEYRRVVEIEHGFLGFLFGKLVSSRDDEHAPHATTRQEAQGPLDDREDAEPDHVAEGVPEDVHGGELVPDESRESLVP